MIKLFGRNGSPGEFKAYEAKALALFKKHGGEVIVAFAPAPGSARTDTPDEIQILRIATKEAFDGFINDPERLGMAEERDAVIRRTEVYLSGEIIAY